MRLEDRIRGLIMTGGIVGTGTQPVNRKGINRVDAAVDCLSWTLIPARCLVCGGDPGRVRRRLDLCRACHHRLPRLSACCPRCARFVPDARTCGPCARQKPLWDAACVAFTYDPPIDHLLIALKFHGELASGVLLGRLLARWVRCRADPGSVDLIVPVPLSARRQAERRYNQTYELAVQLQRRLGIPIAAGALRRIRDTPPQMGLSASARKTNLRNALIGEPAQLAGRRIAILDDVITTGATMTAATRVARAAGAASVEVWAVARAN